MSSFVIAVYKPKPGMEQRLADVIAKHCPTLPEMAFQPDFSRLYSFACEQTEFTEFNEVAIQTILGPTEDSGTGLRKKKKPAEVRLTKPSVERSYWIHQLKRVADAEAGGSPAHRGVPQSLEPDYAWALYLVPHTLLSMLNKQDRNPN